MLTNLMPFVLLSKTGISPNVFNFDAQIKDAMELQIEQKMKNVLKVKLQNLLFFCTVCDMPVAENGCLCIN